jgi:hypothetical protein
MVSRSPALDASIRTLALRNKGLYERFTGVEGGVVVGVEAPLMLPC